jgi:oxygen-independent coproporphyrinogen-3 oxidase
MLLEAQSRLTEAGYVHVGLDLFVRADEDLAVAMRRGRLQRNSWGYSSLTEHDRLGVGLGAISRIGNSYAQNHRALEAYHDRLSQGVLPVMRGIELRRDDVVRHAVIRALLGRGEVSIESMEIAYLIEFRRHFADECEQLAAMAEAGLVEMTPEWITLTPHGVLVVRAVCAIFDRYRPREQQIPVFGLVTD